MPSKTITIRRDDRKYDVTISSTDDAAIIARKIDAATNESIFDIHNQHGNKQRLGYRDLKVGRPYFLVKPRADPKRNKSSHGTAEKLPLIIQAWGLASADDIFKGLEEYAPRMPIRDTDKSTFADAHPALKPELWANRFTVKLSHLAAATQGEHGTAMEFLVQAAKVRHSCPGRQKDVPEILRDDIIIVIQNLDTKREVAKLEKEREAEKKAASAGSEDAETMDVSGQLELPVRVKGDE